MASAAFVATTPSVDALARQVAPVSVPASPEQLLPVLAALEPLVAHGGLRRGSVVSVGGSTSLTLAMVAAASAQGSWCAAVGLELLNLAAAAELGVVLERFAVVGATSSGGRRGWPWVVATLLDGLDVVVGWPPTGLAVADARRLAVRARHGGSVLVVAGSWPEATDLRLEVTASRWFGPGSGHGRLRGRQVEVVAGGKGAASRVRKGRLWLPHPDGGVVAEGTRVSG